MQAVLTEQAPQPMDEENPEVVREQVCLSTPALSGHSLDSCFAPLLHSPEDAYDALKAANDLRAQDEHQTLVKALRAEAMADADVKRDRGRG